MKSWEFYNAARKALKTRLCAIYGNRSSRMIDYWAQDPASSADPKRNPVDRLATLLVELDRQGMRETAKGALRILAGAIDCRIVDRDEVIPDKDTILEEIVDDLPMLLAYQQALQGKDLEEVDHTKAELERELAENRVKFIEVNGLEEVARVSALPPRKAREDGEC